MTKRRPVNSESFVKNGGEPAGVAQYHRAIAVAYDASRDAAPSVAAKAEHLLADQIVRIARRYGIPVLERPELAQALDQVEIDAEIPEELFEAAAIVLRELARISEKERECSPKSS